MANLRGRYRDFPVCPLPPHMHSLPLLNILTMGDPMLTQNSQLSEGCS